jgi:hypothetical protein
MGELVELRSGLATSVGPLPIGEPAAAARAALVAQPEMPTVPSPGFGPTSLLAQAVDGLDGVQAAPAGLLQVDERFDGGAAIELATSGALKLGPAHDGFRAFLSALESTGADGPQAVRVPLVGPVSLALALRAAGVPLEEARRVAGAVVARRAGSLLSAVRRHLPNHTVLVCMNEPGLIGGMHPTFPLSPTETLDLLTPVVDRLDRHRRADRLLIGAHVPGHTDWDVVIASGVSILSMPAASGLGGWAASLGSFLDRGGRIAWGAVPVDQPLGSSEELLWRRLSALWCELVGEGLDPLVLRSRSLVSPVDGLGHFGVPQAELALGLVESISTRVRRQAVAARLSLGA